MAFTASNTVGSDDLKILGMRCYYRAWANTTTKATAGTAWIDLGYVQNPGRTSDITSQIISSARTGKNLTVKTIVTAQSETFTFDTGSLTKETLEAYTGLTGATGASGSFVVTSTNARKCEFLIVSENAEAGKAAYVEYIPSVDLKGTNSSGFDGSNQVILSMEAKSTSDEAATVPSTFNPAVPLCPFGYKAIVPTAQITAVLNTIAG